MPATTSSDQQLPHTEPQLSPRPVVERPGSEVVLVGTVPVPAGEAERTAAAIVDRWQSAPWPAGALALSVFTDSEASSVLTFTQWSSEQAASAASPAPAAPASAAPVPYRLYRSVRGGAVTDDAVAESFPVAFFAAENADAARAWIDGLFAAEAASEGDDREYPGGISANMHVSLDGTSILSFSEWVTEANAVAHITAVWEPVLASFGGTGLLYRHHRTLLPTQG